MKSISFLILLVSTILSSCSPIYIYEVSTLEDEKIFYKGREILTKQTNDVELILYYEDQIYNQLIFTLTVINNSDSVLQFDPSIVYLEVLKEHNLDLSESEIIRLSAIDPESKIKSLRRQIHTEKRNEEISSTFNLLTDLLELGKEVSEIGKVKTQDEINEQEQKQAEETQERADREYYFQKNMSMLTNTREYWINAAFRKTTLFPGDEMHGLIHFPLYEDAQVLRVCIPMDTSIISFKFSSKPIRN